MLTKATEAPFIYKYRRPDTIYTAVGHVASSSRSRLAVGRLKWNWLETSLLRRRTLLKITFPSVGSRAFFCLYWQTGLVRLIRYTKPVFWQLSASSLGFEFGGKNHKGPRQTMPSTGLWAACWPSSAFSLMGSSCKPCRIALIDTNEK